MTDFFILAVAVFVTVLAVRVLILRLPDQADIAEETEAEQGHG